MAGAGVKFMCLVRCWRIVCVCMWMEEKAENLICIMQSMKVKGRTCLESTMHDEALLFLFRNWARAEAFEIHHSAMIPKWFTFRVHEILDSKGVWGEVLRANCFSLGSSMEEWSARDRLAILSDYPRPIPIYRSFQSWESFQQGVKLFTSFPREPLRKRPRFDSSFNLRTLWTIYYSL